MHFNWHSHKSGKECKYKLGKNCYFCSFFSRDLNPPAIRMGQTRFSCKLCDYRSLKEAELESHVNLRHDDIFVRNYDLSSESKTHLKSVCNSARKETSVFPPQFRRIYVKLSGVSCPICDFRATSRDLLECHRNELHFRPDVLAGFEPGTHRKKKRRGRPRDPIKRLREQIEKTTMELKSLKARTKLKCVDVDVVVGDDGVKNDAESVAGTIVDDVIKSVVNGDVKNDVVVVKKKRGRKPKVKPDLDVFDWFSQAIESSKDDAASQNSDPMKSCNGSADVEGCEPSTPPKKKLKPGPKSRRRASNSAETDASLTNGIKKPKPLESESTKILVLSEAAEPNGSTAKPSVSVNGCSSIEPKPGNEGVSEQPGPPNDGTPKITPRKRGRPRKSTNLPAVPDCDSKEKQEPVEGSEPSEEGSPGVELATPDRDSSPTDEAKRLRDRKRKRMVSDSDEFEMDLKEAKRLSKLLALEQKQKSGRPVGRPRTKHDSDKPGKRKWRHSDVTFEGLVLGWTDEDFDSTEVIFLNNGDDDGSDDKKDIVVASDASVCGFCGFYAGSWYQMRDHVTNQHLSTVEQCCFLQQEQKWMIKEDKRSKGLLCGVCEIKIENLHHLQDHFKTLHVGVNKDNVKKHHQKFKSSQQQLLQQGESDESETDSSGHSCTICDHVAKSTFLLQKHTRQVHNIRINPQQAPASDQAVSEANKPRCSICNKTFTRVQDMKRHKLFLHMDKKQFKCEHCSKRFWSTETLELHVSRIHLDQDQSKAEDPEPEVGTHDDDVQSTAESFQCLVCTKEFIQLSLLQCHMDTAHPPHSISLPPLLKNGHCSFSEDTKDLNESLLLYPSPVKMEGPDLGQVPAEAVNGDNDDDDEESYIISDDELEQDLPHDRRFKCDQCEKTYTRKHHLQRHQKQAHELQTSLSLQANPDMLGPGRPRSLFMCTLCGRTYIWKQDLKRHQKRIHNIDGPIYEEIFPESGQLPEEAHLDPSEQSDYRFHCTECRRSYRWKHHLKRHILQVHAPSSSHSLFFGGNDSIQDEIDFSLQDYSNGGHLVDHHLVNGHTPNG